LDPTERFQAEAKRRIAKGERLYFAKDGHWNAAGHELAGEILAEDLRGRFPSLRR
jgi:hypothetical protein